VGKVAGTLPWVVASRTGLVLDAAARTHMPSVVTPVTTRWRGTVMSHCDTHLRTGGPHADHKFVH